MALNGLFLMAILYTVSVARPLLLPIVFALLLAFIMAPVVSWMERRKIPRAIGSGAVVLLLIALTATALYTLAQPTARWLSEAPERLRELERELQFLRGPVASVSEAAAQVSEIGQEGAPPERVKVVQGSPAITLFRGARGLVGTLVVSYTLLFFFLWMGRLFLLKLVRVLPGYGARKRAVRAAAAIRSQASTHLLTVSAINAGLAAVVGAVLYVLGIPNPILWGVLAGLLNFIPYLGPLAVFLVLCLVSITSIEPFGQGLLAPLAYLMINGLEAAVVTPLVLGNTMRINPVAVFVSVLFWGWIWGVPGALLAVPILATMRATIDSFPSRHAIAEFL